MCTEIGAENSVVQRSAISMEKSAFLHTSTAFLSFFFFLDLEEEEEDGKKKGKRDKADSGFRERFGIDFFSRMVFFSVFREEEGGGEILFSISDRLLPPLLPVNLGRETIGRFFQHPRNTRDKSKQSRFSYVTDRKPEIAARYRGFGPLPKRIFLFEVSRHSCARRE